MKSFSYGHDRAQALRDTFAPTTPVASPAPVAPVASPGVESTPAAAPADSEKSFSTKQIIQLSIGGVVVLFVLLAAVCPELFTGSRGRTPESLMPQIDPFKEARSGDPHDQYGIFGRFFCRGTEQRWGCGGDDAQDGTSDDQ